MLSFILAKLGFKVKDKFAMAAKRHNLSYKQYQVATIRSNLVSLGMVLNFSSPLKNQYRLIKGLEKAFFVPIDGRIEMARRFIINHILYQTQDNISELEFFYEVFSRATGLTHAEIIGSLLEEPKLELRNIIIGSIIGAKYITSLEELEKVNADNHLYEINKESLIIAIKNKNAVIMNSKTHKFIIV